MIIQYNTSKAELCFVKVPEGLKSSTVADNVINDGCSTLITRDKHGSATWIKLPEGDWQIVGNPFELSEEQCAILLPDPLKRDRDNQLGFMWCPTDNEIYRNAKDCFNAFISELRIYQTNPYKDGEPSIVNHDVWYSHEEWQEAEERTGSFILLKKII